MKTFDLGAIPKLTGEMAQKKAESELRLHFGDGELVIAASAETIQRLYDELQPGKGAYVEFTSPED